MPGFIVLPNIFTEIELKNPGSGVESTATKTIAILALADGTVFRGISIGAPGHTVAEVVFNTSMTGYQEILTDPSYSGQIVTLTYPHIGNTGINLEDVESTKIHAAGLIVRNCPARLSNFRSTQSLPDYLKSQGIVAIAEIDTRKLTRILREGGAQGGCIFVGDDANQALKLAKAFSGMSGQDLAKLVSATKNATWTESTWQLGEGYGKNNSQTPHVVAYDFGVKSNILRLLAERGCRITVVPAQTTAEQVLALKPDGVFLSNGPGDPETVEGAPAVIRAIIEQGVPMFGICLGHQLMALALGGKTFKLPFGHHGANHPVRNLRTGSVEITSQNHNFCVDPASLSDVADITHTNLNDQTNEGMRVRDVRAFSVQYHPEAGPGPHDSRYLFNEFAQLMGQR